ncbi:DUF1772 domain-containing protein [Actinoplanes bogorensis]|uniref:DUF1772 domain-containing protein n=2 Tax=Paractinoplanes bogorensis TaxID=1610840 RepID=A0ABS5YPH5_9ACTN|nr:DUF1772 domain-containing protein [Actinoplanes bogorensis]
MTTGLMAGVFGLYQHTVMVGLGRTDDRTFIGAFQSMDRAIINPWFMLSFGGALIFTAVAAFLSPGRRILPWVLAALVLYIIVFAITVAVNVPMNDALKAAGDPATMTDPAAVRAAFDEARWSAFNLIRTIATTLAFGCLCWALVARGELG